MLPSSFNLVITLLEFDRVVSSDVNNRHSFIARLKDKNTIVEIEHNLFIFQLFVVKTLLNNSKHVVQERTIG